MNATTTAAPTPTPPRSWAVKVPVRHPDPVIRGLSRSERDILAQLEGFARTRAYCYPSLARLAESCELGETYVGYRLRLLERAGVIRRVYRDGRRTELAGVILLRRLDPDLPTASTPEAVREAEAAILDASTGAHPSRARRAPSRRALPSSSKARAARARINKDRNRERDEPESEPLRGGPDLFTRLRSEAPAAVEPEPPPAAVEAPAAVEPEPPPAAVEAPAAVEPEPPPAGPRRKLGFDLAELRRVAEETADPILARELARLQAPATAPGPPPGDLAAPDLVAKLPGRHDLVMPAARRLSVETGDFATATLRTFEAMTLAVARREVPAEVLGDCLAQAMGPKAVHRGKVLVAAWKRAIRGAPGGSG